MRIEMREEWAGGIASQPCCQLKQPGLMQISLKGFALSLGKYFTFNQLLDSCAFVKALVSCVEFTD